MREIVFDTETTGFDSQGLDRITEIGAIELVDWLPTGKQFHAFLDPHPREVPPKVVELTGLTSEFLRGKPKFADKAEEFLAFIGDAPLVAHNATFDRGFINAELRRCQRDEIPDRRFVDTLELAHQKFPGSPASLDALCKRFDISLAARDKHGAIIDSELLARVYLELRGGRERRLGLDDGDVGPDEGSRANGGGTARQRPKSLVRLISDQERKAHQAFLESMGGSDLWDRVKRRQEGRR